MINKEIEFKLDFLKRDGTIFLTDIEDIREYIDQLEAKVKELGKGQLTLMQSRRKWKNRYYKEKRKNVK